MIISGTIYAPDGRTPLEGIDLFVYQTDDHGPLSSGNGGDNRNTRIHGLVRSDSKGRYEFRTILNPAPIGEPQPGAHPAYISGRVIRSIGSMSTIFRMIRLSPMTCVGR